MYERLIVTSRFFHANHMNPHMKAEKRYAEAAKNSRFMKKMRADEARKILDVERWAPEGKFTAKEISEKAQIMFELNAVDPGVGFSYCTLESDRVVCFPVEVPSVYAPALE